MTQQSSHFCIYETDIKDLKKIIRGNGDPDSGMCVRIAIMSQQLDTLTIMITEIKNSLEQKKSDDVKIKVACIGAIVAVIIAIIPLVV